MMKRFGFSLLAAATLTLSSGVAFADYQLNVLHINDLHSRIEAINKSDATCSQKEADAKECFGGIARVKSAIDGFRKDNAGANILVLDAGDQFQGSLYYSTFKSAPVAEFMNGIGFDAMAIGNHEFDDGPEELNKFIGALKFPIISGNTIAKKGSLLDGKYKGYVVKEIGGQKIGVVSVLATDSGETSSPGPDISFEDEITYLKSAVKDLEGQGVNKIIALTHVGYNKDKEIAAAVDGIDVVVGGHSHTYLSSTDNKSSGPYPTLVKNPAGVEIPVVTAYAYSKYLGELKVTFDDNGVVKATSGAPKLLDASVTPDEAYAARVKELGAPLEELKKKVVGVSDGLIDGDRKNCRAKECSMGNLLADASLARVKDQGITIAIVNGGGLRASIDQGDITMGEVLTVLPFQNTIATFQIKGSDLKAALENGVSQIEDGAGRFVQVGGMKYSFDRSKPVGSRVGDVQVKEGDKFVALDPAKTYGVVTNNYVRGGGDGFKMFATNAINPYDFGPNLEQTVADYLTANNPYKPYTDGRITDTTPADYVAPAKAPAPAAAPAAPATAAATPAPAAAPTAPAPAAPAATAQAPAAPAAPAPAPAATPAPAAPAATAQAPAAAKPAPAAPAAAPVAAAPAAPKTYKVMKGDSLWKIAESTLGDGEDWKKIADANKIRNPNLIEIGSELQIPAK
ncbi:5'-nucleotidase C-terminal domain-containing protein [Rhizobium rhizoryzae]|uniref:5'-nucleotidase n=1 Tax=Rhizobium rhizoryzae TaxID=451876 RepID=A0A7W6LIM8_9HYPH|nr:5'-nucleotidase C-terminal domain-containing protein [Rhizobium rhizoryzae]MBB4143917.1 5'-nucleotidase [Rhizobium rhizoryzae]